jgi:hypothetical protein
MPHRIDDDLLLRVRPEIVADRNNGGWHATALWTYGGTALRVLLDVDAFYAWQSRLRVEMLTTNGWKELHRLAPSQSQSQGHRSTTKDFPSQALRAAAFADEQRLLETAMLLVATLTDAHERPKHANP